MAAAHVLPAVDSACYDLSRQLERQEAVDSVLGTMSAEGELPSEETIVLMHRYVDGQMTMAELTEAIFSNARG